MSGPTSPQSPKSATPATPATPLPSDPALPVVLEIGGGEGATFVYNTQTSMTYADGMTTTATGTGTGTGTSGATTTMPLMFYPGTRVWVRSPRTRRLCAGTVAGHDIYVGTSRTFLRTASVYFAASPAARLPITEVVYRVVLDDWGNTERIPAAEVYDHDVDNLAKSFEELMGGALP